jgi:hypothetical protein
MTDFLKDCYFNGFCKGRKNFVLTPRNAKKLRAMRHSVESIFVFKKKLSATPCSCNSMWNSSLKFSSRLLAMRHSSKLTLRYAAKRVVMTLCLRHSPELGLRTMPHSMELRLPAMQHSGESIFVVKFNRISLWIWICMQNHFSPWIEGPSATVWLKNWGLKISWDCPFKFIYFYIGGVGHFGAYMFLIDIPFKGCKGCLNRLLIMLRHILHVVSKTPHAPCLWCQCHRRHSAVTDPAEVVSACWPWPHGNGFRMVTDSTDTGCLVFVEKIDNIRISAGSLTPRFQGQWPSWNYQNYSYDFFLTKLTPLKWI